MYGTKNLLTILVEAYKKVQPKEDYFRRIRSEGDGTEEYDLMHNGLPQIQIKIRKLDLDTLERDGYVQVVRDIDKYHRDYKLTRKGLNYSG